MGLFEAKKEAGSNYSVLGSNFLTTDSTGMIGVYVSEESRIIYMETGKDPKREVIKYEARIPTWLTFKPDLIKWTVTQYNSTQVLDLVAEVQSLHAMCRTQDSVFDKIQVSGGKMEIFKARMQKSKAHQGVTSSDILDLELNTVFSEIDYRVTLPDFTSECAIL